MKKRQLRNKALKQLKIISYEHKQQIENKLYYHLFSNPLWKQANSIGITVSQYFEWNTRPIIEEGWKQNKSIFIPKSDPLQKSLQFYSIHSFQDVKQGNYNLLEPNENPKTKIDKKLIDLLIVPGLLFNNQGYRIGFGGGYFDRYLSDYKNNTLSLLHDMQLVNNIPVSHFDIPVQMLITPTRMINKGDVEWT